MSSKLSVQQIAKMEGVNDETVRRWIATGALPAYQYPGSGKEPIIRVDAADLERFRAHHRKPVIVERKVSGLRAVRGQQGSGR